MYDHSRLETQHDVKQEIIDVCLGIYWGGMKLFFIML